MNKAELISKVSDATGQTKAQATAAVDAVIDAVTASLKGGEEVRLPILILSVAERKARTARNPKTGETIKVPAAKVVKAKIGKALKDAVA